MTEIKSERRELNASKEDIQNQFSDLNNLKKYLPSDKISDWESDGKSCSFKVMGTYTIGLEHTETTDDYIKLSSTDKSPFPFTLDIITDENGATTSSQINCQAKLNPMLKMMVSKPLKNLFNYIIDKAQEHYA